MIASANMSKVNIWGQVFRSELIGPLDLWKRLHLYQNYASVTSVFCMYILTVTYGSRGRHVSHRACTRFRNTALSAALCAASAHDFHPNASLSFSTIRRHVSFGLPIDLFPTGVQFITIRQSLVLSNRRIWPNAPSSSLDDVCYPVYFYLFIQFFI